MICDSLIERFRAYIYIYIFEAPSTFPPTHDQHNENALCPQLSSSRLSAPIRFAGLSAARRKFFISSGGQRATAQWKDRAVRRRKKLFVGAGVWVLAWRVVTRRAG